MNTLVYIESWQLQCCGEPFSVGDTVEWRCSGDIDEDFLTLMFGPTNVPEVTRVEDHHDVSNGELQTLIGRVTRIASVRCAIELRDHAWCPVPGSAVLTSLTSADGWESDIPSGGSTSFYGYLATLNLVDDDAAMSG